MLLVKIKNKIAPYMLTKRAHTSHRHKSNSVTHPRNRRRRDLRLSPNRGSRAPPSSNRRWTCGFAVCPLSRFPPDRARRKAPPHDVHRYSVAEFRHFCEFHDSVPVARGVPCGQVVPCRRWRVPRAVCACFWGWPSSSGCWAVTRRTSWRSRWSACRRCATSSRRAATCWRCTTPAPWRTARSSTPGELGCSVGGSGLGFMRGSKGGNCSQTREATWPELKETLTRVLLEVSSVLIVNSFLI